MGLSPPTASRRVIREGGVGPNGRIGFTYPAGPFKTESGQFLPALEYAAVWGTTDQ